MQLHLIEHSPSPYAAEIVIDHFPTVLGRSSSCDYQVFHPMVSRRHAELKVDNHNVAVCDLSSSNGTYVNGKRIREPASLHDGDELLLGGVTYRVMIEPENN